jgi:hypothetical protein
MVETSEAKQVSRAASSLLFSELEFGVADNATYPSEDFQRVLARIAFDKVTEFLPKTSSPTFSVRLFYFLFAVALYNLWVLTNLLLRLDRAVGSTSVLPTALFRQFLGPIPDG